MTSYDYIIEEGVQIGREEGRQEGRQEGRREGVNFMVVEMLRKGATLDFVQSVSRLPLDVLEGIQKNLSSSSENEEM